MGELCWSLPCYCTRSRKNGIYLLVWDSGVFWMTCGTFQGAAGQMVHVLCVKNLLLCLSLWKGSQCWRCLSRRKEGIQWPLCRVDHPLRTLPLSCLHTHTPEKGSPIDKKGHRVHSYVIYWKRRLLTSSGLFLWQQRRTGSNLNTYPPPHTHTHTHAHTHTHPLTTPTKKQVFYSVDPIKGSFPEGAGTIKIKRESAKRTELQKSDCLELTGQCLLEVDDYVRFL